MTFVLIFQSIVFFWEVTKTVQVVRETIERTGQEIVDTTHEMRRVMRRYKTLGDNPYRIIFPFFNQD